MFSDLKDFGFTGQRNYSYMQLGLMDYNARFYSPALGRFIQPDIVVPDPTNPQQLNRFSYTFSILVLQLHYRFFLLAWGEDTGDPVANKISKRWYLVHETMVKRGGKKGAKVVVARRLLTVVYYTQEKRTIPGKLQPTG